MKKYDITLTAHFEKNISVRAHSAEQAKEKTKMIMFDTNLVDFTDDDFVCGEVKVAEASDDSFDNNAENETSVEEWCSSCSYLCPNCGERMCEEE